MAVIKSQKLDQTALWGYALRVLGRRAHSAAEIQQKLAHKAQLQADVQQVMAKLREYGFADDEKFSEALSSTRLSNEGFGRQRVLRDLRNKSVPPKVAEAAVEKAFAGTNEDTLIEQFLARKYRSRNLFEFLQEDKNLQSAYRRLRVAGFSSQGSFKALKKNSKREGTWEQSPEEEAEERELL